MPQSFFEATNERTMKTPISPISTSQVRCFTHSYVFLLSKEAHANVVPEGGALRHSASGHAVLVHGHIKVTVGLHHAACSQDGLGGKTLIRAIGEEETRFESALDERWTVPPDGK